MARALRRVLAASAVSATLLTSVAPASEAAGPAAPGCREIREPVTGMWWIIC